MLIDFLELHAIKFDEILGGISYFTLIGDLLAASILTFPLFLLLPKEFQMIGNDRL